MPMTWVTRGPGEALPAGDLGLAGGVARFQEGLLRDGLAQEFDDPGRLGVLGRFRLAPAWQDGAYDTGAGTRRVKAPMLPFSKAPLGPEGESPLSVRGRRPRGRRSGRPA